MDGSLNLAFDGANSAPLQVGGCLEVTSALNFNVSSVIDGLEVTVLSFNDT